MGRERAGAHGTVIGDAMARVVRALEDHGARRGSGQDWTCPAHDDRHASLGVAQGRDGVLMCCQAGCGTDAVLAAVGLTMADLFDASESTVAAGIAAVYPYEDEQGAPLYEVVRYFPKGFRQRRPDGAGGYLWNLQGVRRVLYRLPGVIDAVRAGRRVWVVEGERDVEALEAVGEVATTNSGGAGKWSEEFSEVFAGAVVTVVADADAPGRLHARDVARSLAPIARSVATVISPFANDARDHLDGGHGVDEFVEMDPEASDGASERHPWLPLEDFGAVVTPPTPPSILCALDGAGLLYPGKRHLLSGEYETLKTWIAAAAAAELMLNALHVFWWDADEQGGDVLAERLAALGVPRSVMAERMYYVCPDRALDPLAADIVARELNKRPVTLAVLDAMNPALQLQGLDPTSTVEVQRFLRETVGLFHRRGIATLLIDHVTKSKEGRAGYAYGSERKITGIDVHLSVSIVGAKPTRHRPQGKVAIKAFKDRPGWHARGSDNIIGEFHLHPGPDEPWRVILKRGSPTPGAVAGRHPDHMRRVSQHLEDALEPMTMSAIESAVGGRAEYLRQAVLDLLDGEFIRVAASGRAGAVRYESAVPYRADGGPSAGGVRPDPVQPPPRESVPSRPEPRTVQMPLYKHDLANPVHPRPDPSTELARQPVPTAAPLEGRTDGRGAASVGTPDPRGAGDG